MIWDRRESKNRTCHGALVLGSVSDESLTIAEGDVGRSSPVSLVCFEKCAKIGRKCAR